MRALTPAAVLATAGADLAAQAGTLPAWAPPILVGLVVVLVQWLANRNVASLDDAVRRAASDAASAKALAEGLAIRLGVSEGEINRLRTHYHEIANDVTKANALVTLIEKKDSRK